MSLSTDYEYADGDVAHMYYLSYILKQEPSLCIDIGGYQGWWSKFIHERTNATHILCFEPNPNSFKKLIDTANQYPRISYIPKGISDKEEIRYFTLENGQTHSRTEFGEPVQCITMSEVLPEIPILNIVKIDVEGHEPAVLRTLEPWIQSSKIHTLIMECTIKWYGTTSDTQIDTCLDMYLSYFSTFPYIYLLARQRPLLIGPISFEEFKHCMEFLQELNLQTDIVCTQTCPNGLSVCSFTQYKEDVQSGDYF